MGTGVLCCDISAVGESAKTDCYASASDSACTMSETTA